MKILHIIMVLRDFTIDGNSETILIKYNLSVDTFFLTNQGDTVNMPFRKSIPGSDNNMDLGQYTDERKVL